MSGREQDQPGIRLVDAGDSRELNPDFIESMTPVLVETYLELGLDHELAAMLGRHLNDLNIVFDVASDTTQMTVSRCHSAKWGRELKVSTQELRKKYQAVSLAASTIIPFEITDEASAKIALDWILFEASADALSNTVHMQHKFNRYIQDFNGQSDHYKSEFTAARMYLETVMPVDSSRTCFQKMVAVFKGRSRQSGSLNLFEKR